MSQQEQQDRNRVINSWSFPAFRALYKKVLRPQFTDPKTNEKFTKLAFEKPAGGYCFVGWSKEMGELTNEELISEKDSLRIVELKVDEDIIAKRKEKGLQLETYKVCRAGENSWEEVAI